MALSRTVSEIWPVIGSKSQNFPTPLSFRALYWGDPYGIFWKSVTDPETRVFGAADGEDLMILACTVFASSTRVTDAQTDGRTELRWLRRAIAVPAVTRKNYVSLVTTYYAAVHLATRLHLITLNVN